MITFTPRSEFNGRQISSWLVNEPLALPKERYMLAYVRMFAKVRYWKDVVHKPLRHHIINVVVSGLKMYERRADRSGNQVKKKRKPRIISFIPEAADRIKKTF